jgi:hypothetical protein
MSKKKLKPDVTRPAGVPAPARASVILPFLERRSLLVALAFIVLGALRVISTYSENGLTWDEPAHLACGLQYLAEHVYAYEPQHPPLARLAAAFVPYLAGARPLDTPNFNAEGVNVIYHSSNPGTMIMQARFGILPFFLLGCLIVYFWARRYFGGAVAALSTALFTLVPTVLAHAGLATTDMALTSLLTAAFFALLVWAEEPTWLHSILLGLATGLAAVSKFTALGFYPAAVVFAAIAWFAVTRPGVDGAIAAVKSRALPFLVAVACGAITIWATYSFTFGTPKGWNFSVPAPALFEGIDFARYHNARGHAAYFMGEIRNTGWWYFFPVLLLLKTPLAWLILVIGGLILCFKRYTQLAYWMPVAFALGSLIPGMTSNVNIGLRHILPIYSGLAILAGLGLYRLLEQQPNQKWAAALSAILPVWLIVSGALQHSNYLAYFNELVGDRPERIVTDSDLDWGQDTVRLARRLKQLGATQVNFNTLNLGPEQLETWPGLPKVHGINPIKPYAGWTAVSPTIAAVREYGLEHRDARVHPWFTYIRPVEHVGSLLLYYVPAESIPPDLR